MNTPDVIIYSNCKAASAAQWKESYVLKMHTMPVSGIDWCHATNQIVTCSADVNAFVWVFDKNRGTWIAKVAVLRSTRAALRVKWSPDGNRFGVATGSKIAAICFFHPAFDWWSSRTTKKHKSTLLDIAWHPSSQLYATACCDYTLRVFSAYNEDVDKVGANTCFGSMDQHKFGQLITEFKPGDAWIEAVHWAPSGNRLAFAAHDSSISFVDFSSQQPICTTVKTRGLPFTRILFLNNDIVVAAGHNFTPEVFEGSNNNWRHLGSLDKGDKKQMKKTGGGFAKSMNKFKSKVKTGQTGNLGQGSLTTIHTNLITDLSFRGDGFATSAQDGNLVLWNKAFIKRAIPGLSI